MLSCAPRNAGANQQSSLSFSQKAKLKRKGLLKSSFKKRSSVAKILPVFAMF
jgi:hypothetical protein